MLFASEYIQIKKIEKGQIDPVENPHKQTPKLVSLPCRTLSLFGTNLETLGQHPLFFTNSLHISVTFPPVPPAHQVFG